MRLTSFNDTVGEYRERLRALRRVRVRLPGADGADRRWRGRWSASPTCRRRGRARDERCYEAYNIQVHGLMKRLISTGIKRVVIGVSGGLDSTHALIVAAKTMDRLGLPRSQYPGLHHARLRHQHAPRAPTPTR